MEVEEGLKQLTKICMTNKCDIECPFTNTPDGRCLFFGILPEDWDVGAICKVIEETKK